MVDWQAVKQGSFEFMKGFAGWRCADQDASDNIFYTLGAVAKGFSAYSATGNGIVVTTAGVYGLVDAALQLYQVPANLNDNLRGIPALVYDKGASRFVSDIKESIDRLVDVEEE